VRADGIGIPLGPAFSSSSQSGNSIAQSLLASGGSNSGGGRWSGYSGNARCSGYWTAQRN